MNQNDGSSMTKADAREQLSILFDETYTNVYRFCFARSGSESVAEDISAEVFAEVARRFADGRNETVSVAWLLTVARRRLIDHWRAQERHRRRLQRVIATSPPQVAVLPETDGAVLAALRSLPDRQRLALTARYLDDLSVQEVADMLDTGYQAVESLLARARRSFAKAYEAHS